MNSQPSMYLMIGQNIRRLRVERKITQIEAAEACGYKVTSGSGKAAISRMEKVGAGISLDALISLSQLFGVTLDEFFKGIPQSDMFFDRQLKEKLTIKELLSEPEIECLSLFRSLGSNNRTKAVSYLRDLAKLEELSGHDDQK